MLQVWIAYECGWPRKPCKPTALAVLILILKRAQGHQHWAAGLPVPEKQTESTGRISQEAD